MESATLHEAETESSYVASERCHSCPPPVSNISMEVLEHTVEAAEDGQLVDLLRHLLQRLQLLQTQQHEFEVVSMRIGSVLPRKWLRCGVSRK